MRTSYRLEVLWGKKSPITGRWQGRWVKEEGVITNGRWVGFKWMWFHKSPPNAGKTLFPLQNKTREIHELVWDPHGYWEQGYFEPVDIECIQ